MNQVFNLEMEADPREHTNVRIVIVLKKQTKAAFKLEMKTDLLNLKKEQMNIIVGKVMKK